MQRVYFNIECLCSCQGSEECDLSLLLGLGESRELNTLCSCSLQGSEECDLSLWVARAGVRSLVLRPGSCGSQGSEEYDLSLRVARAGVSWGEVCSCTLGLVVCKVQKSTICSCRFQGCELS